MTYVRSGVDTAQSGDTGGTALDYSVDLGAAVTNGVLLVWLYMRDRGQDIDGVTWNGVSMTALGSVVAQGSSLRAKLYRLVNPASGSHTLQVDPGAASGTYNVNLMWELHEAVDQADPEQDSSYTVGQGTSGDAGTVTTCDVPSTSGKTVAVAHGIRNSGGAYTVVTATGYTQVQGASAGASVSVSSGYVVASDGTAETSAEWNDATASSWIAMGVCLNPASSTTTSPSINTRNGISRMTIGSVGQRITITR